MKHKKILAACCFILMVSALAAQKQKDSYASVSVFTGQSSLGFKVKGSDNREGAVSSKIGLGAVIKYQYYFSSHLGIGGGIGVSAYNSDALLVGGMDGNNTYALGSYRDDDDSGLPQSFDLRARIENVKEKQNILFFEIPVALLFKTRFTAVTWGAYGSIGFKLQIPALKRFEAVSHAQSRLNVSGFYSDGTQVFEMGAPGTPPVEYHGFGTIDNPGSRLGWKDNTTGLLTGVAGTIDAGLTKRINLGRDLLAGVYLDYGFNDLKKNNKTLLSGPAGNYHPEANDNIGKGIIYNGLLNSSHTDMVKPLSYGIKIGLRFKL